MQVLWFVSKFNIQTHLNILRSTFNRCNSAAYRSITRYDLLLLTYALRKAAAKFNRAGGEMLARVAGAYIGAL